jgi:membrane protein YqaA with SNARE-associated domain
MSVKSKLARQAVMTTAKHTAHGAASKATRKPFRSISLLALGAALGGLVGWLIGRSGGGGDQLDPIAEEPAPPSVATNNSTEHASETGAVS